MILRIIDKGIYLLIAATLLSCSGSEDIPDVDRGNAISFDVTEQTADRLQPTRSALYSSTSMPSSFKVWGYVPGTVGTADAYFLGSESSSGGIVIDRTGSTWDYHNASDVAFWPKESSTFYAVSPYSGDGFEASKSFTVQIPTANSSQADVMAASATGQTSTTNDGKVALAFSHLLSKVSFKGFVTDSRLAVQVSGITIHNLASTRTYSFDGSAWSGSAVSGSGDYSVTLTSPVTVSATAQADAQALNDVDGVVIAVPQTPVKWSCTDAAVTTIAQANTAGESYLEITCKVKDTNTGNYLYGSDSAYGKMYFPFGTSSGNITLQQGKSHVVTLGFGLGRDETGVVPSLSSYIQFTVSVLDWGAVQDVTI